MFSLFQFHLQDFFLSSDFKLLAPEKVLYTSSHPKIFNPPTYSTTVQHPSVEGVISQRGLIQGLMSQIWVLKKLNFSFARVWPTKAQLTSLFTLDIVWKILFHNTIFWKIFFHNNINNIFWKILSHNNILDPLNVNVMHGHIWPALDWTSSLLWGI